MEKERNLADVEAKALDIRLQSNMTQRQLARELNVSPSYVSNWENGYNELNIQTLNKFCNYYNVCFDYMFGLSNINHTNIIKVEKISLDVLGSRLRNIRKELKLTQDKTAEKMVTNRSLISYYELGRKMMSTADLKQFCKVFGCGADYCVGRLDNIIYYKPVDKIKVNIGG